jgi:hypothetical protein
LGTWGLGEEEKRGVREGFFAKFFLVGWAAGGPSKSGRRE